MAPRAASLSVTSVGIGVLVLVGGALWFGLGSGPIPTPVSATAGEVDHSGYDPTITVHVSGSVVSPGVVTVPPDARIADVILAAGGATPDADLGGVNLAATVRDGEHIVIPRAGVGGASDASPASSRFDINTASPQQLEALPGVGPVLAERIASYRDHHGPFATIEDLLGVPGIGESKLAAIRDFVEQP